MAPINACGTRWIGHLVKALQRTINKFGIYLTDLEKFSKKGKKVKTKAEISFYLCFWVLSLLGRYIKIRNLSLLIHKT